MNAKKTFIIWLFGQLTVTAFAGSRMTVDQLNQLITSNSEKRDAKIADRLLGLELTERLSVSKLAVMEKTLPGPESRRALVALADQAVFLDPPPGEIPNHPAPNFEQQRAMIAKTVDYVTAMLHRLPNLFARRDTIHFEDTPPGLKLGGDRRIGKLDIFLVQREDLGVRSLVSEQTLVLDLKPATYEKVLRDGIPFDQYFDDKENSGVVRIIVVDENSGRIGSVTLLAAKEGATP